MLETTWFVLWGLLWAVYFVLDGFDFGMLFQKVLVHLNQQPFPKNSRQAEDFYIPLRKCL